MNLPNDIARCSGQSAESICDKRDACRRFLDPVTSPYAVNMDAQPAPCGFHIPAGTETPNHIHDTQTQGSQKCD